jgi:hypothetical protein
VALSDAADDTVQTYEYSVYGEVAVEDANHPNPKGGCVLLNDGTVKFTRTKEDLQQLRWK